LRAPSHRYGVRKRKIVTNVFRAKKETIGNVLQNIVFSFLVRKQRYDNRWPQQNSLCTLTKLNFLTLKDNVGFV